MRKYLAAPDCHIASDGQLKARHPLSHHAWAGRCFLFAQDLQRKDAVQHAEQSLKAPLLSKLLRSVVIDGSDNGAEAELKLHLRDDSPRQVAVQEERAAPPYDA